MGQTQLAGIVGLAVCFIMASYSGCDKLEAILYFSFASGFAGLDNSRVNNMDLSPNYAPTIIAIVNSFGSVMGILAPVVVGLLTTSVSHSFIRSTLTQLISSILLSFQDGDQPPTIYEWRSDQCQTSFTTFRDICLFSDSFSGSFLASSSGLDSST